MREKISFDDIVWQVPRVLFRGTFQSYFEAHVLRSLVRIGTAAYSANTIESTCCTPDLFTAIGYALNRSFETTPIRPAPSCVLRRKDKNLHWPFSKHTLIMSIRAEPYRERLFVDDGSPDAIQIQGPIRLEDITILYSSHINIMEGLSSKKSQRHLQAIHKLLREHAYQKGFCSEQNLMTYLAAETRKVMRVLCGYAFPLQLALMQGERTPEEIGQLADALHIVAEKLELPMPRLE